MSWVVGTTIYENTTVVIKLDTIEIIFIYEDSIVYGLSNGDRISIDKSSIDILSCLTNENDLFKGKI